MAKYYVSVSVNGHKNYEVEAESEEEAIEKVRYGEGKLTLDKTYIVDAEAYKMKED